jgi:hypothetical protein
MTKVLTSGTGGSAMRCPSRLDPSGFRNPKGLCIAAGA